MKNFIPVSILAVLCFSGLFYAFTDTNEADQQNLLHQSKQIIKTQTACIDDLESSLYDFSTDITNLRAENTYLVEENTNLRGELYKQATRAAKLRSEVNLLEVENYNVKRQLDQILIAREIRARHQSNGVTNPNVASLMPTPDADGPIEINTIEIQEISEVKARLQTIQSELEVRTQTLATIAESTKQTFATIQQNEAKVQYNIDVEPASNPTIEYADPLVSQDVLYPAPIDQPKLFTQLEMTDEVIASADEDEFTSKSPVYSLIENTDVIYNYIACRNDRYGKKIKKLKQGAKNWKYTFLQFNLETENANLLLNKDFRMRVLSTDLNTYLNFTTDKQPEAASYYDFIYEGEPVKISFFNDKNIKGNSFDIQIFHIVDNEEYLLEDDQQTIFTEGRQAINKLATK